MAKIGTKSVRVDLDLWVKVKYRARFEGMTMQGLITVLLRKYLKTKER